MEEIKISKIEGFRIGHAQNKEAATGCSVIICERGAVTGVDVRGGAPGTRETDLLNPLNLVDRAHAVLLTGGSAFGLDAAGGIMKYLEERNIGFDVGVTKVPIVCAAALFDLTIGDFKVRPDAKMGYLSCLNSEKNLELQGNIGAGTGATIGKILGSNYAAKGGLSTYAIKAGDLMVGAVVAVNCLGNVVDIETGEMIGGVLNEVGNGFLSTEDIMISKYDNKKNLFNGNTTIGAVITNAALNKSQMNKVASMAHNGFARVIYPAHTMYDGDTIFAMSSGEVEVDVNVVGMLSAKAMERAIIKAVKSAESLCGYKCYKEIVG